MQRIAHLQILRQLASDALDQAAKARVLGDDVGRDAYLDLVDAAQDVAAMLELVTTEHPPRG